MTILNEQIGITAHFNKSSIKPLLIIWGSRKIRIVKVTGFWKSTRKGNEILNLSVVSENGTYFEISFNAKTFVWMLKKVETE